MKALKILILITQLSLLGSCASNVPLTIRNPPADSVTLEQVHNHVHKFRGRQIRWGGTIIRTETLRDMTRIEIVERPLSNSGQPLQTDQSDGRFIALIAGFIEPETFSRGRRLTVTGTISTQIAGQIGEHPYDFPVINVGAHYLWPKIKEFRDHSAFYRDPFYDPFDDPFFFHRRGFGYW